MTEAEYKDWHEKREKRLKKAINEVKSSIGKAVTLKEKLAVREKQKKLEEELRQHRLDYFKLMDEKVTDKVTT